MVHIGTKCNVFYNSDLGDADFLGACFYILEDCIETCASSEDFQTDSGTQTADVTCYEVTFAFAFHRNLQGLVGKCFLENASDINTMHLDHISAASLVQLWT